MWPLFVLFLSLGFPDAEYLCTTLGTCAAYSRSLVLHGDLLGILDFDLAPALYAICLWHYSTPPFPIVF